MALPGSEAPPVRVEITELTSETGEQWGKGDRGEPRVVEGADGKLRYQWHASLNMGDTHSNPAWGNLDKDRRQRKRSGEKIDGILLEFLARAESQMGTIEGAVNLANQHIDGRLKPGGELLIFPFFRAQRAPSGGIGGLRVSYDGYSVDLSSVGSTKAAESTNREITRKAARNQAGALPGQKWLVMHLDPNYAIAVGLGMEKLLRHPPSWIAFASLIDRRHFEEVWLVWKSLRAREGTPHSELPLNVIRLTPRGSRYMALA
ncbi:hypothetical protein [Candidatus Poriferisocius sp.]|uniref:hypothetical protein n=1 Tax=Candidatus Poriferisocius sp. TaxID=3101276 RepID=UPI003B0277E5